MNTHFTLDRESFQNLLARASLAQEYLDSQKATHPGVDLPRKPAIGEQPKEASPVDYIQSLSAIGAVQSDHAMLRLSRFQPWLSIKMLAVREISQSAKKALFPP